MAISFGKKAGRAGGGQNRRRAEVSHPVLIYGIMDPVPDMGGKESSLLRERGFRAPGKEAGPYAVAHDACREETFTDQ